jgi:hypothetical protein
MTRPILKRELIFMDFRFHSDKSNDTRRQGQKRIPGKRYPSIPRSDRREAGGDVAVSAAASLVSVSARGAQKWG